MMILWDQDGLDIGQGETGTETEGGGGKGRKTTQMGGGRREEGTGRVRDNRYGN